MNIIVSHPRKTKSVKFKRRLRLVGIFGSFIMTETKKRHELAVDLEHALNNLEFLHSHSAETLSEFANWLLLTYFDYVEISLLKDAILYLPQVERTEKPTAINELLETALTGVLSQTRSWNALLGWTAARLKDKADVSQLDNRLIWTVNNLPQHQRDKLIKQVRYGQDSPSMRRYGTQRLQKPEQSQKSHLAA